VKKPAQRLPCAYREAIEANPPASPAPWRLRLRWAKGRRLRAMEVVDAEGGIVEHRMATGFPPEQFARHVANASIYVGMVNGDVAIPSAAPAEDVDDEEEQD